MQVQQVKDILRQLRHFARMEELLRDYYAMSHGPVVPGPITFTILESLRKKSTLLWQAIDQAAICDTLLSSEAAEILSTTSSAVDVSASTTMSEFCNLLCGEHLRLEALGIIYSVTARACKFIERRDDSSYESFIYSLYVNSLECRTIARQIAPINDALVWLTYENVILTSYMHGDSSELVWQRLDHLSGDVMTLGLHRESCNTSNTPPFVAELRRRTFHKAYGLDVYLSGLFDRPPRVSKRHADCILPLDLPDEEVCTDDALLHTTSGVSDTGWNLSGETSCATWVRTRSLFSTVKEEIAECSILTPGRETCSRLCALSVRLREIWNGLPLHIRDTPTQYSPDANAACALTLTRLKFLQSEMHIHAILKQQDQSDYAWEPLLQAAAETMAHLLRLGNVRENIVALDFPDMIVNFGLASAGTIATALQDLAANRAQRLPTGLSRAALIKDLLRFTSHLEALSNSSYHSSTTAFSDAAKTFARAVDYVLDEHFEVSNGDSEATQPGVSNMASKGDESLSAGNYLAMPQHDLPLNNLDLTAWLDSLEWTGTTQNWMDF